MNKNTAQKIYFLGFLICVFTNTQASHDIHEHAFPKTLTFLNNTDETILISLPAEQKIAPGESFLLSDDYHQKKPKVRWHVSKNIESGIHIHSALFTLDGNILDIVELYDENPQGAKSILKPFKKIITLSSTSENFTLFKNGRLIDIEQKN